MSEPTAHTLKCAFDWGKQIQARVLSESTSETQMIDVQQAALFLRKYRKHPEVVVRFTDGLIEEVEE